MIAALTRRIQETCGDELLSLRQQASALTHDDSCQGTLEATVTVLTCKPSVLNRGVSVHIACFTPASVQNREALVLSVSMRVHHHRPDAEVYWDEADAWAHAIAGGAWNAVKSHGGVDKPGTKTFQYELLATEATG